MWRLLVVLIFLNGRCGPSNDLSRNVIPNFFSEEDRMRGVCWVAGDSIVGRNFRSLINNGVDYISQTPFAWQNGFNSPSIGYDNSRAWWGERDAGIIHTTVLAHEKGMKVMLKPHIWLTGRNHGKWRSDIEMKNMEDWDEWFHNYNSMIMHYAHVAQNAKIESLCIGTELTQASTKFPDKWRAIIKNIRKVYDGQLTYAGNFYEEYENILFWDDLDFIGIQAYFPLSSTDNPDLSELQKSWRKIGEKLKRFSHKWQKPIVFTEIGYKNTADAAKEPWVWPGQVDLKNVRVSEKTQALCYEAMFHEIWNKPHIQGVFIWKWYHGNHQQDYEGYKEYRQERRNKRRASQGLDPMPYIEFSPQGMEAETIMQKYYRSHKAI